MKDKVKYILEIPVDESDFNIKDFENKIQNSECDIAGLKFNKFEQPENAVKILKELLSFINKPLMIRVCSDTDEDKKLLSLLAKNAPQGSIIACINENNYKEIVPEIINNNHFSVIRTPIDINLCKEMNILVSDMGLDLGKIIIDTDIGGLGYGLEYGYSMMEKIKLEAANDKYLNMPIISFVTEETAKTKEAKIENNSLFFEITSACAVKAAGADFIVMNSEQALRTMKGLE